MHQALAVQQIILCELSSPLLTPPLTQQTNHTGPPQSASLYAAPHQYMADTQRPKQLSRRSTCLSTCNTQHAGTRSSNITTKQPSCQCPQTLNPSVYVARSAVSSLGCVGVPHTSRLQPPHKQHCPRTTTQTVTAAATTDAAATLLPPRTAFHIRARVAQRISAARVPAADTGVRCLTHAAAVVHAQYAADEL